MTNVEKPKSTVSRRIKHVLPGEKLATIEEFAPGTGSAIIGDSVISTIVGEVQPDLSSRVINVKLQKTGLQGIPSAGDYVTGTVQSAQPSMAQVKIEAVNDEPSSKEFTGMLSMRDERRRRTSSPIKTGDVIRAQVISTKNAIFHLTVDCSNCGVLFTVCSNCGNDVVAIGRDRVKCKECGWVEERLLAEDFIRYSRGQSNS